MNEDAQKTVEQIAETITQLSKSVQELLDNSNLNEKALVILLAHSSKLSQSVVKEVLYSIYNLEHDYIKKDNEK